MKKSIWMSAIGLALAIAVSAPASAQGGGGRGQGRGQQATLATIPVDLLAGPLKLTDEQKTKIKAAQEKVTKAMAEARAAAQNGGGGGGAFQAIRETQQAANTEITGILTEEQKGKVEGVVKEFGAYQQLGLPLQVVGELKLTDDQKSKIKPIAEEMQKKVAELRAGGGQPDRQAMQQIRQDYTSKAAAILTDDQKKAIEKWRMANPMRRPGGNPPN
jgi:cell division protein ZapA (FtsZ GTPase activity inhibitor)